MYIKNVIQSNYVKQFLYFFGHLLLNSVLHSSSIESSTSKWS